MISVLCFLPSRIILTHRFVSDGSNTDHCGDEKQTRCGPNRYRKCGVNATASPVTVARGKRRSPLAGKRVDATDAHRAAFRALGVLGDLLPNPNRKWTLAEHLVGLRSHPSWPSVGPLRVSSFRRRARS